MISTIFWALVVGVVLGYLGKLLLPGRQDIPAWATIGVGIVAALVGGWVASLFDAGRFAVSLFQIAFAVVGIWITTRLYAGRRGATRYR
jgi:uncharacterized membrane protein YeaQ/YmgE (transglycosylase-associated protein family)